MHNLFLKHATVVPMGKVGCNPREGCEPGVSSSRAEARAMYGNSVPAALVAEFSVMLKKFHLYS